MAHGFETEQRYMGGLAGRKEKEGIIILKIVGNIFLKATFQPLRIHSLKAKRDLTLYV